MLPDFRSNHCSTFWRAIYLVCMFVVFSYILFDVLDLDGSDFPRPRAPVERNVVVAEVLKDIKLIYGFDKADFLAEYSLVPASMSSEPASVRLTDLAAFLPLVCARVHGYRVALPRSSPSDPFPSL